MQMYIPESHAIERRQPGWAKLPQQVHLNIRDIELQYLSTALQYGTNTATAKQVENLMCNQSCYEMTNERSEYACKVCFAWKDGL
jgi:hypothetical protein